MTPEQLATAPCRGKTAMFTVPTDLDPNPWYHERKAKGLCALCPADTFRACGAEAEGDTVMIRQGATPNERRNGAHNKRPLTEDCVACGMRDWSVVNGVRSCRTCKARRDRARYVPSTRERSVPTLYLSGVPQDDPCKQCGTVSWVATGTSRKCSECQRIRDRERYRARGR